MGPGFVPRGLARIILVFGVVFVRDQPPQGARAHSERRRGGRSLRSSAAVALFAVLFSRSA